MNRFETQWAVMMPNGELACHPGTEATQVDYSMPSPARDMLSMFGMLGSTTATPPAVAIFDSPEKAEAFLKGLRAQAKSVGVDNWGGVVVSRICSPFVSTVVHQFVERVVTWAHENGGGE